MSEYIITSKAGVVMGIYIGDSESEALLQMHREAGYSNKVVWLDDDGDLEFDSEETKNILGNESSWHISERAEALRSELKGFYLGFYDDLTAYIRHDGGVFDIDYDDYAEFSAGDLAGLIKNQVSYHSKDISDDCAAYFGDLVRQKWDENINE